MTFQAQAMRAWLWQRLSAVYIAIYLLSLIVWMVTNLPITYDNWYSLFSHPLVLVTTVIFYLALFVHAWVGLRDIMLDYVKPSSVRFILLTALALFLLVMTTWLLLIIISLVKV